MTLNPNCKVKFIERWEEEFRGSRGENGIGVFQGFPWYSINCSIIHVYWITGLYAGNITTGPANQLENVK